MLVKATEVSSKLGVKIKELGRVASRGEVFDVTPLRFKVLAGDNRYKAVFVQKAVSKENEIDAVELYNKKEKQDKKEKQLKEVKENVVEEPQVESLEKQDVKEEPTTKKKGRKKKSAKNN